MNISYKLTLNEYQEAVNFHYKTGKRPLFIAVFLGTATFMMLVGTDFSNSQEVINNILMTFFALAFYILFTRMITAYRAKKMYKKSPILSNEITLHISGKGIKKKQEDQVQSLTWENFSKWKKNEKYYLIYTTPNQFNVIPSNVMSETQKEELETYLNRYLKQHTK
jgi:hypothetical protein